MTYDQEACSEYARQHGRADIEENREQRAWILTPYDSWERNPFYRGPEVPHPESEN